MFNFVFFCCNFSRNRMIAQSKPQSYNWNKYWPSFFFISAVASVFIQQLGTLEIDLNPCFPYQNWNWNNPFHLKMRSIQVKRKLFIIFDIIKSLLLLETSIDSNEAVVLGTRSQVQAISVDNFEDLSLNDPKHSKTNHFKFSKNLKGLRFLKLPSRLHISNTPPVWSSCFSNEKSISIDPQKRRKKKRVCSSSNLKQPWNIVLARHSLATSFCCCNFSFGFNQNKSWETFVHHFSGPILFFSEFRLLEVCSYWKYWFFFVSLLFFIRKFNQLLRKINTQKDDKN